MIEKIARNNGFTLVEMSIVLIVVGLMTVGAISAYTNINESIKIRITKSNMAVVSDALSAYAMRNNRIPCPADPVVGSGIERGSNAAGSQIGNCRASVDLLEGVVPYRTLGITSDFIRDGWGNLITYRASEAYTLDPEIQTTLVHQRCQTDLWIEADRSINPLKARFCCTGEAQGANQEVFVDVSAAAGVQAAWPFQTDRVAGNYGAVSFIDADGVIDGDEFIYGGADEVARVNTEAAENIIGMAYYIISHGQNGVGAFTGNGIRVAQTNAAIPETYAQGGNAEQANANSNNSTVSSLPHVNIPGANYYDDFVYWQTNAQLLARIGRTSCFTP